MIKNIGVEIDYDVFKELQSTKLVGYLTTYSDKGMPLLSLVSTIVLKNREGILMAILADTPAYKNIVWQKKVMLSFFESHNLVLNIIGRAGVVRAPSKTHPLMNIVQIDLIGFCQEAAPSLITITSGIKYGFVSREAKELHDALIKELNECVKTGV
jgi:hypothetical protein